MGVTDIKDFDKAVEYLRRATYADSLLQGPTLVISKDGMVCLDRCGNRNCSARETPLHLQASRKSQVDRLALEVNTHAHA